ncbi:recombinase family protein [Bdellovibrionota bacterium FG-2]
MSDTNNDKVTALYCRTSTDRQGTGLEAQERALLDFCRAKSIEDYIVFRDEGISGIKSSRPSLDKMMALVREGKISSVVVYSFSRFARSTQHLLEALEEFKSHGVAFASVSESVDTGTPMGKAVFTILSAISQLEREILVERVKNGLHNARAKGKQLGRKKTRNSKLIKELASQGMCYRRIAELANCGITTVHRELSVPKSAA